MTKWEKMARQDFTDVSLARFFEISGKYEYAAGMAREDADKRAYLELKGVKR